MDFIMGLFTDGFPSISQKDFQCSILITLGAILGLVYYLARRPANSIRDLTGTKGDIFFKIPAKNNSLAKEYLKSRLQITRGVRKLHLYPNGWFNLIESSEVRLNGVKYVMALGENFAVFRKSNGKVHVVDAFCPHLGANMGIGGSVKNDCLECPFHGWQFDGETGKCNNIPYAKKIPEFAKVRTWRSVEVNDIIFVWYHAEGIEPSYEPQPQEEIMGRSYKFVGRTEFLMEGHIEDALNLADYRHVDFLHVSGMLTRGADVDGPERNNWLSSLIEVSQNIYWKPDEDQPHLAWTQQNSQLRIFKNIRLLNVDLRIKQVGSYGALCDIEFWTIQSNSECHTSCTTHSSGSWADVYATSRNTFRANYVESYGKCLRARRTDNKHRKNTSGIELSEGRWTHTPLQTMVQSILLEKNHCLGPRDGGQLRSFTAQQEFQQIRCLTLNSLLCSY